MYILFNCNFSLFRVNVLNLDFFNKNRDFVT